MRLSGERGVILTAVLAAGVFLGLGIYGDFSRLADAISGLEVAVFLQVIGLATTGYLLRFVKWEFYLRHLDIDIPVSSSFHVFFSGLMMVVTPGKLGEFWKAWYLEKVEGVGKGRTVPVVGAERVTDLLALGFMGSLGIFLFRGSLLVLGLLLATLILGILVLQWRSLCLWILELLEEISLLEERMEKIERFYEDSYSLFRPYPLSVSVALSILAWGLEGMALMLVVEALGAEMSLAAALFVFGLGSVVGAVSMLPGGLGATEASMVGLLVALGVVKTSAVASTLVIRAGTLWYGAGLGLLVFFLTRRYYSR